MRRPFAAAATAHLFPVLLLLLADESYALGNAATLAISYGNSTVCGVAAASSPRSVYCSTAAAGADAFQLSPNISFDSVSGGRDFLCGLRSGDASFYCWNAGGGGNLRPKRVYNGPDELEDLTVGVDQIAAVDRNATGIRWWRGDGSFPASIPGEYHSLTSGSGFSCAIGGNGTVRCWGSLGDAIQADFANLYMKSIVAGDAHACGLDAGGRLLCKGNNESGQAQPPSGGAYEFSGLALGSSHTCALRRPNNTVVCWGGVGGSGGEYTPLNSTEFELLVAGGNLTCGVMTANLSVVCWGSDRRNLSITALQLPRIVPGICVADGTDCSCGLYPDSENLCSGSGVICNRCDLDAASPSPAPSPLPPPAPPTSKRVNRRWVAFAVVGAVGSFAGICAVLYCLWAVGVCGRGKVHNLVQPTIGRAASNGAATAANSSATNGSGLPGPFTSPSGSKSRVFRRQLSRVMQRQRSGPSSFKDRAEEFTLAELAAATKNFSMETKIGGGSFGTVYKGQLPDGREVAIKRSESGPRAKKFQEKESAFQSELAFLSRLHHKHLVGLVGYCEEKEERLLVYGYMKNGALYDHLHSKNNTDSPVRTSWKMRIKVLLDASRGIEYLHNYAVPPIIHRDIKSSNILLDASWVARVSDFGLSLMGPESEDGHLSMKAAGTVGYMDPEYYGLHHLTVKSDVYGFGVVMLEVLTGKRAIFKEDGEGGKPVSVVDYAVPSIVAGDMRKVLDARAGQLVGPEAEAVELVGYTAVHCVRLEGRERPVMTDIVANLETALALCEDSRGSISGAGISLASLD